MMFNVIIDFLNVKVICTFNIHNTFYWSEYQSHVICLWKSAKHHNFEWYLSDGVLLLILKQQYLYPDQFSRHVYRRPMGT